MKVKKTTAKATLAGALGAAAVGLGAGIAHADPFPAPPRIPGFDVAGPNVNTPPVNIQGPGADIDGPNVSAPGLDIQGPDANLGAPNVALPGIGFNGPGANIGAPGNPYPPGLNGELPPGHGVPDWAPPQPPPPPWAPFAPVQWNAEAQAWGVYTNAGFQAL